jgi:hypothetical protein
MGKTIGKSFALTPTQRDAGKAFERIGKQRAVTEYEKAQEAFRENYERLRSERLAREAARSNEK